MNERPSKSNPAAAPGAITREFTVLNRFGIHARPAALFVKMASRFQCEVTIERDGMVASGKSIMGLLTLEGYQGAVIKVTAVGADAEEALDAIGELMAKKFFED
ncbi:MAG: HPr family phosphocarrier protein [Kiritimatiellae bacterium]|nr:HPr family phosphocarrier protein [Kiritimatiellia bacterium]MCO5069504.1 HPr family phosphocarrier protein [Kiritimatiellia bacterium]